MQQTSEISNKKNIIPIIIGAIAIIISVASYLLLFQSSNSLIIQEIELEHVEFMKFIEKFDKDYEGSEEHFNRFSIYRTNSAYIRLKNQRQSSWKLSINKFADLTHQEFKSIYLASTVKYEPKVQNAIIHQIFPANVDWRSSNKVTPVKNQGYCGSSWAFSTTGAIESAYSIKRNELHSLSEQQLIDCSTDYGNKGCNSGSIQYSFDYAMVNGLVEESKYPYNDKDNRCHKLKMLSPKIKISNYAAVTSNSANALASAVAIQPVSVNVDASIWQFYDSGVIGAEDNCGTNLNSQVLVVGYDMINSIWIVKNSWGSDWGEQGYINIAKIDGQGVCGIQMMPYYPIV